VREFRDLDNRIKLAGVWVQGGVGAKAVQSSLRGALATKQSSLLAAFWIASLRAENWRVANFVAIRRPFQLLFFADTT
jgi:hypothetical protein